MYYNKFGSSVALNTVITDPIYVYLQERKVNHISVFASKCNGMTGNVANMEKVTTIPSNKNLTTNLINFKISGNVN